MTDLTRTTLAIEQSLLEKFDRWMARRGYTNRSEAVRDFVRAALVEQEWSSGRGEVAASLSIIYDHAAHTLAQHLTSLQHEDHHAILCSQHVHLDHHRCLEVIVMRGEPEQLRRVADAIVATKGVLAGKLTLLSLKV